MKNIFFFRVLITLFLLFFLIVVFLFWGFYVPKNKTGESVNFIVNTGEGVVNIANRLEKEGVIQKNYFLIIYGLINKNRKEIKPGNYLLSPTMNVKEVIEKLIEGDNKKITIIEGWGIREVAEAIEKEGYGEKEDFYFLVGTPPLYKDGVLIEEKTKNIKNLPYFLGDDISTIEGYIFPDTYFFPYGTSLEEIVFLFLDNFNKKVLERIKEELEEKELSLSETVVIASLLEKEVKTIEDKKIVAGIIKKRIERGMRLQLDATVTYLTNKKSVSVSKEETRINSLYNTYVYNGLPPAPICNPGVESIIAAMNPEESDYLYYLSKKDGETVFSKTFEEHKIAKNNYLK